MKYDKKHLTIDQHKSFGLSLASIRDELVRIHVEIVSAKKHPQHSNAAASRIFKAQKLLDEARSYLEEAMFSQLGDDGGAKIKIYYPEHDCRLKIEELSSAIVPPPIPVALSIPITFPIPVPWYVTEGWKPHPQNSRYYYKHGENPAVRLESELIAMRAN